MADDAQQAVRLKAPAAARKKARQGSSPKLAACRDQDHDPVVDEDPLHRCAGGRAARRAERAGCTECATTSSATPTARSIALGDPGGNYQRTMPTTTSQLRPSRGDMLELPIDSLAHGGNSVARLEGYVVFVAGAVPGDRVRAVVGKAKKAYAEARAIEIVDPSPDRVPEVADHPGAPWQVLPYERQLEVKAELVATRWSASAGSRATSSSRSCPPTSGGATATRSITRSGLAPAASSYAASTRPALERHRADDRLQARLRALDEVREQCSLAFCRLQGLRRVGPARPARLPAQPRSSARAAPARPAGPAGDLARQARRRR